MIHLNIIIYIYILQCIAWSSGNTFIIIYNTIIFVMVYE